MRSLLPIVLLIVFSGVACSDEGGRDGSFVDTGVPADSGRPDTGVPDSGVRADAAPADAQLQDAAPGPADAGDADSGAMVDAGDSGASDAGEPDAEVDAGEPDAGAMSCGDLIKPCTMQEECGDPNLYYCGPQNLCVPMPDCGGFVMALCPPARPVCLYYTGADFGPCFTLRERDCICTSSTTAALFQGC